MKLKDWIMLGTHRFRWGGMGGDDCMTFPASWMLEATGIDPAADYRGTYSTKDAAHSLLQGRGGALPFAAAHLEPHGCKRIQQPQDGDIGLVRALSGETCQIAEIGAVRFGPMWAFVVPGGVRITSAEMVAAWSLPA